MKFLHKIRQNFYQDRETLRRLSPLQKIRFLLDYYRGYALALLCLCLIGFYIGDAFLQSRRETVLEGFFTNDDENLFPAGTIAEEFSAELGLTSGQQVIFDDSLYVKPGSSFDYHTASQGKIMAYISARELDFLVTTADLAEYYSRSFPLMDLEEFLPDHLLTRLRGQLYYSQGPDGAAKAFAVSLKGSRFAKKAASDQTAPHCLMVFSYTDHTEAMIRFLEYAFEPEQP